MGTALVQKLASDHSTLLTVEENSIGGFATQVQQVLLDSGYLDGTGPNSVTMRSMMFPDRWIEHDDDPMVQYDDAELNATDILTKALAMLSRAGIKIEQR